MKITAKIKMFSAIAITIFAFNANAQTTTTAVDKASNYDQGFRLGFGVSGGYVFDDPYIAAAGGDIRLQYDLSKRYSITLTTGYTHLFTDNKFKDEGEALGIFSPNPGRYRDLGFVPVKAGFKGFFWEDQFYAMGEAGAGFAIINKYDETTLILAPSIGYANKYFDISIKYEYYNDFPVRETGLAPLFGKRSEGTGQLGLRIAYGFKL